MLHRVAIVGLAIASAYAVANHGGAEPAHWNRVLLIIGLAGVLCARPVFPKTDTIASARGLSWWAVLLFPAYVALQLLPLPLSLLRVLDPTRADIAGALKAVMPAGDFAPLTIVPSTTWIYLSEIAAYTLIFLLIRTAATRFENRLWSLAIPLVVIGGVEMVFGFALRAGASQAMSGTYDNKNHFAGLLEMVLPLVLMYGATLLYRGQKHGVFAAASTIRAAAFFALAAAMFAAITLALSKMGFISMLGSLLVMGILSLGPRLSRGKRWTAAAALGAAALFVLVFVPTIELVKGFGEAASDPTGEGRWSIAKDTLHLIAAYPLFGTGLGTYYPALLRYQTVELDYAWINAHNDYLQLFSELGIVGFLIPAALVVAAFARAVRTSFSGETRDLRFLGVACAGSLAAMLIHSAGDFNLYVPANAMVFAWMSGLASGLPAPERQGLPRRSSDRSSRLVPRSVFVLGCFATLYAGAWLVFLHSFKDDARAERRLCQVGICDYRLAREALQRERGGDMAAVPPEQLAELVRRDPAGPYNWEDLGDSFRHAGRMAEARYSYARALALGPRIPYMQFRAARFHFDVGERVKGLDLMSRSLAGSPGFQRIIFDEYSDREISIDDILHGGLPNESAGKAYLRKLLAQKNAPSAATAWNGLIAKRWVDDGLSTEYVNSLIQARDYETAAHAWARYAGERSVDYLKSNFVYNGGFEVDPIASPFDWQLGRREGVTVSINQQVAYAGQRSARIRFDGTHNVGSIDVYQSAFVPTGWHTFQAYVKTESLTTDQGIFFGISATGVNAKTDSMTGTTDWQLVERSFQVPPDAGLVTVRILRNPSLKFDNQIKGTVWIDQVKITSE